MKVFAKFEEIPSMSLEDIKETKRYGHTFVRSFVRSFGRTDNVKTVYPPTNTVCGGYKNMPRQWAEMTKSRWFGKVWGVSTDRHIPGRVDLNSNFCD